MIKDLSPKQLRPRLTANAKGDLFLEITVNNETVVQPLPSMETRDEAQAHIDKIVPEMVKRYYRNRRNKAKRLRRCK